MKSRFNEYYSPVDIPIMIDKICGKSDRSRSILQKLAMTYPVDRMYILLLAIDKLGLWGDRLYWYRESVGPTAYDTIVVYDIIDAVEQDDIISVKSQEEMTALLVSKGVLNQIEEA